jgi:anti-anti-sigma factor
MDPCSDLPDRRDLSVVPNLFDECRVVRTGGELDVTTVPAFADALGVARRGTGRLFLIVDLSGVTFMDGSVLAPLCSAWQDCRERFGWIRVVHTRPSALLVLRAAGLLDRFPPYATAQDAWHDLPADRATAHRSA